MSKHGLLCCCDRADAAERVVDAVLKLPDYEWSVGQAQRLEPAVKAAFAYMKRYENLNKAKPECWHPVTHYAVVADGVQVVKCRDCGIEWEQPGSPVPDSAQPKCKCCCHTDGGCHSRYIPQDWCCEIPQFRSDQVGPQNRTLQKP